VTSLAKRTPSRPGTAPLAPVSLPRTGPPIRALEAAALLTGSAILLTCLASCAQQAYQKDTNSTNYNYQYNTR